MVNSGNGHLGDIDPDEVDVYERIIVDEPLPTEEFFKENLGTGEREIVFELPPELTEEDEEEDKND